MKEYPKIKTLFERDERFKGIVARTMPYLYDWRGDRIMWKLKGKDFAAEDPRAAGGR